jgi:NADH-quinone oxidoreductase subunit F
MQRPLTEHIRPNHDPLTAKEYVAVGGYEGARLALGMQPSSITQLVQESGLRGRGGAGFSTGFKMSAVPLTIGGPKFLIANADEMEPGTFKDRWLLEGNPHQLIEGMIISSYAILATKAIVFMRGEYSRAQKLMLQAIHEAYAAGFLGERIFGTEYSLELHLHKSSGRYICGEETALINALEGKRATPRAKPPYPQLSGLWGRPTLVQNVETLSNLPHIIKHGSSWFKSLSRGADAGTKIYGVSGKVKRPGAWELPLGTPMREIIEEYAGGIKEGLALKAVLPGGASTEFLLEDKLDLALDYSTMAQAKTFMGTGTMIVLDNKTCPVGMMLNLERFFKQESCGFCTPCRDGLNWISEILCAIERGEGQPQDRDILLEHGILLKPGSTFCPLAPGASMPLLSGLQLFADEFAHHFALKRCPYANHCH